MSEVETYSFGEWLKQRREQLRLTQRELAATVHCSVAMIKKIEGDERHPSPELAVLLATALKVPETDHRIFLEVARGERPVDFLTPSQNEARALPSPPFHSSISLPKPMTPFVGRTNELAQIGERLAHPNCRILTLIGPGGVGKTRLALAAAQAKQSAFVDGVAYISLTAITDTSLIPETIARGLRLTLSGPPAEQVLAYLRRANLVLILDNCEQLEGDLSWLSELMAHAPRVKLMATSRERLHLIEEWVYSVPELAEAAILFTGTALRVKHDFNSEGEQAAILRICQLVENLPLAVELAAGWTPLMPCNQIADHIQRDINILSADVRNVPERHRSVQAVFDHSWNLLSTTEQNALMRLSVFSGGWEAEEALPVAGADLLLLRRLVDKSLVRVGENGRYNLHELIRQYASRKLVESGLENETLRWHFDAYLALVTQLDDQQFGHDGMEAVMRFDREHDNMSTALAWGFDKAQTDVILRLLYHLGFYWARRGYYYEGGEWAIRAIQQAGERESPLLCRVLSFTSAFLFLQGRYGEAELLAGRAVVMARRLEEPETLIMALSTYTFSSVNVEEALTNLHEGIDLVHQYGKMPEFLPLLYQGAATWLLSSGRYAEADDYLRKSITLFRRLGATDLIADPLGRLGELALQQGRLREAYDLIVESITAAEAAGYAGTFGAWGESRLGLIQLYLGEVDAAQRSLEKALLLFEDGQDARTKLETLAILSEVALARGDKRAAADCLRASLDMCQTLYHQLQATRKMEGTPDALPVDFIGLCSRAALVAAAQEQDERAVTLYSIADSLWAQSNQVMTPPLRAKLDESMAVIRARLSKERFDTARETGQKMTLSEIFEFLLA